MEYFSAEFTITAADGTPLTEEQAKETAWDITMSMAAEAGFESFSDISEGTRGYVQRALFDESLLRSLLNDFPMENVKVDFEVSEADHRDWNEQWELSGFEPIVVGGKCVIHDNTHPYEPQAGLMDITIEAKLAFGTGTHETTRMMVGMLLNERLEGKRLLDCGCGTGILSLVAAKGGAREVVAYDIDEWSVENTQHNAQLNGISNIEVWLGDINVLSHVPGVFDVVLANINRNILLADMAHLRNVMAIGGRLIVSGFYVADGMKIAEKAGELGFRLIKHDSDNDWCCLVFESEN